MPWNINCYFVKIYMQEKNKFYVNYKKNHAITMIIVHIKAMTERWWDPSLYISYDQSLVRPSLYISYDNTSNQRCKFLCTFMLEQVPMFLLIFVFSGFVGITRVHAAL